MGKRDEVKRLMATVEEAAELLWKQKAEGYQKVTEITKELGSVLSQMLECIQTYQLDEAIATQIVEQLKMMVLGLEKKDEVLLADTLNYRIYNTLVLYDEMLETLEEEQV